MKKNLSLILLATLTSFLLAACKEKLPVVIQSEVTGSGADNSVSVKTITAENDASVQILSYKSWINVKGRTKGSFDHVVTVTLNNELPNTAMEVNRDFRVDALTMNMAETEKHYKLRDTHKDGFVMISDSVLVYTLRHGNFTFSYELMYEVPVYDDGVTREVMPYYRYENLVDKGYTIESQDSKVLNGTAYGCALYRHSIEVTFNDKVYTICANITLLKELGPASEPYVVRTKVLKNTCTSFKDYIMSYITIQKEWSTGKTQTTDHAVILLGQIQEVIADIPVVNNYSGIIQYESSEVTEDETYNNGCEDNIFIFRHRRRVQFNWNCFYLTIDVYGDTAYYDDDITFCQLKGNDIIDINYGSADLYVVNQGVDEGREFIYYKMNWSVNGRFENSGYKREFTDDILCFTN